MRDYSLLAKFNDTDLSAKFTILTGFFCFSALIIALYLLFGEKFNRMKNYDKPSCLYSIK